MREGLRYGQVRVDHPNGDTEVSGKCKLGHHIHTIVVPTQGLEEWLAGNYIQVAMPSVPVGDREFLISASCSRCFDDLFKYEDDEVMSDEDAEYGEVGPVSELEDGTVGVKPPPEGL